ncbi:MAG: hypothetical protein HQ548_07090 [Chloroflexi bacterium]|nr:hypothetical protein [Chloroflexota bacterium]
MHTLSNEVERFYKSRSYSACHAQDVDTREHVFFVHFSTEVDENWSVLVGEYVYQLRSSLDHMIYQMACPPVKGSEFPIFVDRDDYCRRGRYKIRGIPTAAVSIIEDAQPWNCREPTSHPLWLLQELSNIDKHRRLHLTSVLAGVTPSMVTVKAAGFPGFSSFSARVSGPIESGAEVLRFSTEGNYRGEVKVDRDLTIQIAFDDPSSPFRGMPVIDGLGYEIGKAVTDILNNLRPFVS